MIKVSFTTGNFFCPGDIFFEVVRGKSAPPDKKTGLRPVFLSGFAGIKTVKLIRFICIQFFSVVIIFMINRNWKLFEI